MHIMNCILVFTLTFVGINALDQSFMDSMMEKFEKAAAECAEETHASDDDIAQLVERKIPDSHEGKCLIFCLEKTFHLMNEDGSVDGVGSVLFLDPLRDQDFEMYKKVLGVFAKCGQKAKFFDDPCETAAGLAKCGQVEAEALGLSEFAL